MVPQTPADPKTGILPNPLSSPYSVPRVRTRVLFWDYVGAYVLRALGWRTRGATENISKGASRRDDIILLHGAPVKFNLMD